MSRIPTSVSVESASTSDFALAVAQARTGERRCICHGFYCTVGHHAILPPTHAKVAQPEHLRPAVSVMIPTRDRADLLGACLKGFIENTAPADLGGIVIDNESSEPATLALVSLYEQSGSIRRISLPRGFKFARACNIGVDAAQQDHILLLNNKVEPIDRYWLECLAGELDYPTVGAAGNLLLFPDGFVQHGRVTLRVGTIARHSFRFLEPKGGDDRGLLRQRRYMSAVTAPCLLTRKNLWRRLGGMDEQKLTVAFNDVDNRLKLRDAGLCII